MRRKLLLILMLLLLGASATVGYVYYSRHQPPPRYLTGRVERGRVAATVNATGTLNAVVTVQVGSQVSGNIQKLLVDYNSPVTENQIIAQIDPASFETRVTQARATLASAQAAVQVAQATVENSKAAVDTARANAESAKANIEKSKVALTDAKRTLDRNKALLRQSLIAQSDLDTAQTVAASLQAPTLFLIAQDFTKMQVDTSVSEADIGRLQNGQRATFTVDAYPNTPFTGRVVQVRNAPITVQNVVTYDAVVEVPNQDLKLKPGMTANVTFLIAERSNVLKVPNAALRFQPAGAEQQAASQDGSEPRRGDQTQAMQERLTPALALTAEQQARVQEILQKTRQQAMASRQQEASEEERRTRMRQMREQTRAQIRNVLTDEQRQKYAELLKDAERQRTEVRTDERPGRVWILNGNGAPESTALRLGISDDTYTEVVSGDLREGQEVITGILTTATRTGSAPPGFGSPRF